MHTRTYGNYKKADQQIRSTKQSNSIQLRRSSLLGEANFTGATRNYSNEEIDKRQAAAAP